MFPVNEKTKTVLATVSFFSYKIIDIPNEHQHVKLVYIMKSIIDL